MKAFKIILVLTLITAGSGAVLALWDEHTSPMVAENKLRELEAAIARVLPAHERYQKFEQAGQTFYVGYQEGQPIGVAFNTSGPGFQGKVGIMVGLKPDFTEITGMEVIEQIETPGLGTKIVVDPSNKSNPLWFPQQFQGLMLDKPLVTVKNQKAQGKYQIEAITGATISSKAVANIVSAGRMSSAEAWAAVAPEALNGPTGPEPERVPEAPEAIAPPQLSEEQLETNPTE